MLVKALINLIGIYPVGTCVILDTFEVASWPRPTRKASSSTGRWCASRSTWTAASCRRPGTLVSLTEQDDSGAFRRSIVKVTNPDRYGLTVGDYFV